MYDFKEAEKKVLKFWEQRKIFEKLRKKIKGKKRWSFLDGPITANNPMGVHHAWGRTYKDLYHRFKAMNSFDTRFQNGFDCQGLWVEREEEKALGLNSKKDIEKFGILNFVKACKKRVEKFSKIQTEQSIKLGQWMDWKNSYYTMSDTNQLHNWFLLKKYFDKGLLYKGKDAVPWCPRCGTASSKHDILTEGYIEVTHKALFMRFPVKGKSNEYFLIFTTTPWTVPANVVIAVNEKVDYVKVSQGNEKYWLAKKTLKELKGKYKIIEKKKGGDLEGIKYEMPYAKLEEQRKAKSPHKVVLWNEASEDEGTGIVHCAPGCGTEDYDLSKKIRLPAISPLDEAGIYGKNYGNLSNKKYSEVNKEVLEDLEKRGFVYKIEPYKHRYPHCWRCGEELVFRLVDEWYIKCKEAFRKKLISANKKVKWYPEYGKIRQEDWFKNMSDWMISQKRYWGLPLPIWECPCGKIEVMGSLKELRKKAINKKKVDKLPEIHKPWIDEIKIKCRKCKKEVKRIPDIGITWLDAGIVSFSSVGPYLSDKKYWKKWFPAELISENMPGQYRGWFNALFWSSVMLTGKAPFKAVFGYETLKDEKGEEMHKSKGNVIWFDDAVEKIGADAMRLLYCLQDPSQELRFGFNVVKEPRNNINVLYNLSQLIENSRGKVKRIEDKWILSRLNSTIKIVASELEQLHPHLASRALQDFWLNDLSRGYVQFVRERIGEDDKDVMFVLKKVYLELLKLVAPFLPFITEKVWQNLREKKIVKEESIHLTSWPKPGKTNKKLEEEMQEVLKIIEKGLAERDKKKTGLKWPLSKATITAGKKLNKQLQKIIARQLNVKKIELKKGKLKIKLDFKLTKKLESEGYAREISRKIQAERKKANLVKKDKIILIITVDKPLLKILETQEEFIKQRVNAKKISLTSGDKERFKNHDEFKIKEKKVFITFKRV